jgi:hypothetical protein
MRAKFRVHEAVRRGDGTDYNYMIVQMHPVYSDDPESENHAFWTATPSGTFAMQINNPAAFDFFEAGQEFYIDMTKVESEVPSAP